jgi:hypothetical protein
MGKLMTYLILLIKLEGGLMFLSVSKIGPRLLSITSSTTPNFLDGRGRSTLDSLRMFHFEY